MSVGSTSLYTEIIGRCTPTETEELSSVLIANSMSNVRESRTRRLNIEKPVKPELKIPPRIDTSPKDIARGLFNHDIDWNKVDEELDQEFAEHERKLAE
ncbi:MAG: hypothetical protein OXC83_11565 [Chloroflexi bacterium]|nr:hypothetical protein [Chloroflexota bacterium]